MEDTFGHHDGAVRDTQEFALDNGGNRQADNLLQADLGLVEHLRDDGHRAVRALADTQGEVAGAAAHSADDEPVTAGAGILVNGAGQVGAFVLGGIETEGRGVSGQRQVVVDGLGNVDVLDGILLGLEELGDAVGRGSGIVTADGNQQLDVVLLEEGEVEVLLEILVRGFETAHLEVGTAPVEIGVRLEEIDILDAGILAEKSAVTAMQADNTEAVGQEGLSDRADNGVHARGRATATEDNDRIFHDTY